MPIPRATWALLLAACFALFSALIVASRLTRSALEMTAPESSSTLERRDTERTAPLVSADLKHRVNIERPSEHFRILYEGPAQQSIGDRVARVLEVEYARIGRTLNSFPADPITVVLYTNREFQDVTRSPSWATGHYDGRISVAVGGTVTAHELDRVVTHELVHAIVAHAAPRRVPAWLNEGLATYLEGTDRTWTRDVLRKRPAVVPLDALVQGFSGLDEERALVAYAESGIAAEILCAQLGPNIGGFLQSVGSGRSIDDALLEFHVQPNAFHSEWRRRVGLQ
jgi:hypothetical protein